LGGLGASFGSDDNIWTLAFNQDIPLKLNLEVSDSDTTLDLTDLFISELILQQNGREMNIDLSGNQPEIKSIKLGANGGKGTFNFTGDFGSLETIQSNINASVQNFDLRGHWRQDVHILIDGGTNNAVSLELPEEVGTKIEVKSDKINVSGDGFTENDRTFTNPAYGNTNTTIYVTISFSSGDLNINQ